MTLSDSYKILVQTSIVSIAVPLIACLLKRNDFNKTLWALFVYLCMCLISDLLLLNPNSEFQNAVINIFAIAECTIICLVYFLEFDRRLFKIAIGISWLSFLVFALWQFFFMKQLAKEDIAVCSFEAIIILIFSCFFIVKFLTVPVNINISRHYLFWIILSNLAYFSTALIFFMFGRFIQRAPYKVSIFLWGMHDIITIACYILFTVGIWKVQKK